MQRWVLSSAAASVFIWCSIVVLSSVSLAGQGAANSLPGAGAVKALVTGRTEKGFVPQKTPWGDPDLQGNFTTKDEANTPMERPARWTDRRMEDITPEELAAAVVKRQQRAVERAPFAGGGEPEEGIAIAVPIHWFSNLDAANSRPWFVIDPPNGRVPPLTHTVDTYALKSRGPNGGGRNSYTDRSLTDRCIAGRIWRRPGLYGNSYQIVQTPDHVVFRYEAHRAQRIIPINRSEHISLKIRPHYGNSVGHWDGNTLVVETSNFPEDVGYRGYSAKNMRLIERFTRIAPGKVEWSVTIDDPAIYTRPWTYSYPMTENDTEIIYEYACHEGNYGLANILSAGRKADKNASARD